MTEPLANTGDLSKTRVPEIFLRLLDEEFSGSFALIKDQDKRIFVLLNGLVVDTKSQAPEESLIQVMLDKKWVDQNQLKKIWPEIQGKAPSEQCVEMIRLDLISSETLVRALETQAQIRIENAIPWSTGKYVKIQQASGSQGFFKLNPVKVCFDSFQASAKADEKLLRLVPSFLDESRELLKHVPVPTKLARSIQSVDGNRSLADLSRPENQVALSGAVTSLVTFGLVKLKEPKSENQKIDVDFAQAALEKTLEEFNGKNYFEILGLDRKAPLEDIKKSYFNLARVYHPDRVPSDKGEAVRRLVEQIFGRISIAESVLSSSEQRKEYEASLDRPAGESDGPSATEVLESELLFQEGQALVRKGSFLEAKEKFQKAIALFDGEPQYYILYGWSVYRSAPAAEKKSASELGKKYLKKALDMNEKLGEGHYYMGMLAKSEGDLIAAKKYFERTLELLPYFNEASSELRLINSRLQKDSGEKKKGFWKR